MAAIAILLGFLSLACSLLFFLGWASSPVSWAGFIFGLAALALGFAERKHLRGRIAMGIALLALLPALALIGWIRTTVG